MKQVFAGEVYEILPLPNGIIFSYCKDTIDNNVVVFYKMISFDNGSFTDVAKNVYLMTKFGNNYKSIIGFCDNYITAKSIILPNGKVFLLSSDGTAHLFDTEATEIWNGEMKYRTFNASDVVLYKNSLWASYSDCNVLLRYNLTTMREELRIGGNKSPFNKPTDIFVDGDNAIISNADSCKLVQVNLNGYSTLECESFEEPVYQYVKVGNYRFALLKSGLYLL